jgi:hypothetical protein
LALRDPGFEAGQPFFRALPLPPHSGLKVGTQNDEPGLVKGLGARGSLRGKLGAPHIHLSGVARRACMSGDREDGFHRCKRLVCIEK